MSISRMRSAWLGCGVIAPLLYVASDVLASLRYDGYSYVHQTISELNAFGAPTRGLTIAFGLVLYALLIGFGVTVWKTPTKAQGLRVAGALLATLGILSLWAVPFASMQVRGVDQGLAHVVAGAFAVLMILGAIALGGAALGRGFRLYSVFTMVLMIVFGAWAGMHGPLVAEGLSTPWIGVKERVSAYSYQVWIAAFAVTLLRRETSSPPSSW